MILWLETDFPYAETLTPDNEKKDQPLGWKIGLDIISFDDFLRRHKKLFNHFKIIIFAIFNDG